MFDLYPRIPLPQHMMIFILTISFLPMIFSTTKDLSTIRYNSLISAQCKARCLYEYRNHRSFPSMFIDGKTNRLLSTNTLTLPWRSIWERCPRLITCSSCLLPCDLDPPLLLSNKQSCQAICSTFKIRECEESCLFIQNLYEQKLNCLTSNCQLCAVGNDCSEKIPQPSNVIAIERKSRRTVRLKWNSDTLINAEPIFYVIEAQWTLPKTDLHQHELVAKWGFVKEEVSNTKAIIRNIQRDNRWYKFRIAAVTRHGHSAFIETMKPFRLSMTSNRSSEILANQAQVSSTSSSMIDPPKNFSIKDYQFNSKTINITLQWEQANSPVNGYQISWEYENNQSSIQNTLDTSSLELTISFLLIDKTYLFQIRSIHLTNGNPIEMSLPMKISFNYDDEYFSIKNFQISPPYFINGLIKANISWEKIPHYRIKQYDIYWIESQCHSDIFSCCYRRDAVTIQNYFQLYDLRFNCTYLVNIKTIDLKNREKSFQYYFNVSSCQLTDIYGTISPPCQTDRKTIDTFSSLPTFDLIVTNNRSGLNLFWQHVQSSVHHIFYRLRIEQLPNHIELLSIDLPSMITNYFLPYSNNEDNRYMNVTLSLMDNIVIRQQQSILIQDKVEDYFVAQLKNHSSRMRISLGYLFVLIVLMSSFDR